MANSKIIILELITFILVAPFFFFEVSATNYCENITSNLTHYWGMENTSTGQNDSIGTWHMKVLYGDPLESIGGKHGSGIYTDGNDCYQIIPSLTWPSGNFTWCIWVNTTSTSHMAWAGDDRAGGENPYDWLWRQMPLATYTNKFSFWAVSLTASEDSRSAGAMPHNTWQLNCIQFGKDFGHRMYVNGTAEGTQYTGTWYPYDTTMNFGCDNWVPPDYYWTGTLDEGMIWSRLLNTDELNSCLWNSGSGNFYPFSAPPVNQAPTIANVTLKMPAYVDDDINCSFMATDIDGNNVNVSVGWWANNVKVNSFNHTFVNVANGTNTTTAPGTGSFTGITNATDVIKCYAYVTDGALSTELNSSPLYVWNRNPVNATLTINTPLYPNDWGICSFSATDPDARQSLNASVTWYVNTSAQTTYNTSWMNITQGAFYNTSVNGTFKGSYGNGDQLRCQVNLTDGYNITLGNSTPVTPERFTQLLYNNSLVNYFTEAQLEDGSHFYVAANLTMNSGVPNPFMACYFNSSNITGLFGRVSTINETINTTSQHINLTFTENSAGATEDRIMFSVCKETVATTTLQVYVDNFLHRTLSTVIPVCGSGYYTEENMTLLYIANTTMNLSLGCSDCNSGSKRLRIISIQNSTLHWERKFSAHYENMLYNSTSKMYIYEKHLYGFPGNSISQINVTCNSSLNITNYITQKLNLTITILSIDDVPYTGGMQVESNESTFILSNVYGGDITNIQFNVSYNNGTFIRTSSTEHINLSSTDMPVNGIYNITIRAVNDEGNITVKKGYFQVNDTVIPMIVWHSPLSDNSSIFNNTANNVINIDMTDVNFFGYEFYIYNPMGALSEYHAATDLGGGTYNFMEYYMPNQTGIYLVNLTAWDSHTSTSISDWDYDLNNDNVKFRFGKKGGNTSNVSISYLNNYPVDKFNVLKKDDRYAFTVSYMMDAKTIGMKEIMHTFQVQCEDMYYIKNSSYTAHFVCWETKKWIDFNSTDVQSYKVRSCGRDCYDIDLYVKPGKEITFNTIGGLNSRQETVLFTVNVLPPTNTTFIVNICPPTTQGMIGLLGIITILVFAAFIAYMYRITFIAFMAGFGIAWSGTVFVGCHRIIGGIIIVIGIYLMGDSLYRFLFGEKK